MVHYFSKFVTELVCKHFCTMNSYLQSNNKLMEPEQSQNEQIFMFERAKDGLNTEKLKCRQGCSSAEQGL